MAATVCIRLLILNVAHMKASNQINNAAGRHGLNVKKIRLGHPCGDVSWTFLAWGLNCVTRIEDSERGMSVRIDDAEGRSDCGNGSLLGL